MNTISPETKWSERLKNLFDEYPQNPTNLKWAFQIIGKIEKSADLKYVYWLF